MANRSETLDLIIRARDAASSEFRNINKVLGEVTSRVGSMTRSVLNLKTAFAGLGATLAIRSVIQAANESARASAGLDTALRSMGRYTPELSRQLKDLASSFQDTTNFEDDATIQGQKFLVTYKGITDDLLPRTTKTMLDLAALMGGDTVQAAHSLGKASIGMTSELRRIGIVVDEDVFKMQGFTGVLGQIERQVGNQAVAARQAVGPWEALGNFIGDLKEEFGFLVKAIADGIGEDMINALKLGIDYIKQFRESADFGDWAKNIREQVIGTFEKILIGAAQFYDGVSPMIGKLRDLLGAIWDGFKSMPDWMQEVGLVAAILGGKKIAAAVAGLSLLYNAVKNIGAGLGLIAGGTLKFTDFMNMNAQELDAFIKDFDAKYDQIEERTKSAQEPVKDIFKELAGADTATKKVQILLQYLRQLRQEREAVQVTPAAPQVPGAPQVDLKLLDAQQKASLDRLKETTKTSLLILENIYKDGKIKIEQYFAERKELIGREFDAELKTIEDAIKKETDASARVGLEAKAFALREGFTRQLLELDQQKADTEKKLDEQEVERRRIVEAIKLRTMEDASGNLKALFTKEMAEMDIRHQEEIKRLEELNAAKSEIDEAYRLQKTEKDRLMVDQERRLMEYRLQVASEVAGGMASIFDNLYEMTGKKQREFFYLSKAAALAEATMNTANAVTKALSQGGMWGVAQSIIIGLQGAMQVAKITAQQLAAGGIVGGISPHSKADDKLIAATAGEFVQPVDVVRHYGLQAMEALRQKLIPKNLFAGFSMPAPSYPRFAFQEGGMVGSGAGGQGGTTVEASIFNVMDSRVLDSLLATSHGKNALINFFGANARQIRRVLR